MQHNQKPQLPKAHKPQLQVKQCDMDRWVSPVKFCETLTILVGPTQRGVKRLVEVRRDDESIYTDRFDTLDATQRRKFVAAVATALRVETAMVAPLDARLITETEETERQRAQGSAALDGYNAGDVLAARILEQLGPVELFHSQAKQAYARITFTKEDGSVDHRETYRLISKRFRRWLQGHVYHQLGATPGRHVLDQVVETLEARALFDGPELPVAIRVAAHEDKVFLDLGDDEWRAVEITVAGWRVVREYPCLFVRPDSMRALPRPKVAGSNQLLKKYVNFKTEADFVLFLGVLVGAFLTDRSFAILFLLGPKDAAKSTVTRVIKRLLDPEDGDFCLNRRARRISSWPHSTATWLPTTICPTARTL